MSFRQDTRIIARLILLLAVLLPAVAQEAPRFTEVLRLTNSELSLKVAVTVGRNFRIEAAAEVNSWQPLVTIKSAGTGTNQFTDTAAAYLGARFYRAVELDDAGAVTGDHVMTAEGDVLIRPVTHASFVMRWQDKLIYNDPDSGAALYQSFPKADLILVSHSHGDHFDAPTIDGVKKEGTVIIAPAAVYSSLSAALKALTIPLANGASTNVMGLTIEAVPAYNANHPKGAGNGYVVTIGGKRFYMAGDTGNTAEMRALQNIDVAFLCMNVPFTMSVTDGVTATKAFRPRVVYPYHFRNQDGSFANLNTFKQQVGYDLGIEVRARKWY